MKDKAYNYRYELEQTGPGRVELFGRDTKLSSNELEQMRRQLNKDSGNRYYVVRMWLINQRTEKVVARSSAHTLKPEPLFTVEIVGGAS
jgi:hypothetical protein